MRYLRGRIDPGVVVVECTVVRVRQPWKHGTLMANEKSLTAPREPIHLPGISMYLASLSTKAARAHPVNRLTSPNIGVLWLFPTSVLSASASWGDLWRSI